MSTKPDFTYIAVILDRSGSMSSLKESVISGFNELVVSQKNLPGQCQMSFYQFDDKYETSFEGLDLKDVPPLTNESFVPRGWTAMLDAMGRTINSLGAKFAAMKEEDRPSKIIVATITDGHENASKEFTYAKVHEMVTHQTEKYNWQFLYLGANQDAILTAKRLGVSPQSAMTFNANAAATVNSFTSTSNSIGAYRKGSTLNSAYTDTDRRKALVTSDKKDFIGGIVTIPSPTTTNLNKSTDLDSSDSSNTPKTQTMATKSEKRTAALKRLKAASNITKDTSVPLFAKMPSERHSAGRNLALSAQAMAHAINMLDDASMRLGSAPAGKEIYNLMNECSDLIFAATKLCQKLANLRDKADGY